MTLSCVCCFFVWPVLVLFFFYFLGFLYDETKAHNFLSFWSFSSALCTYYFFGKLHISPNDIQKGTFLSFTATPSLSPSALILSASQDWVRAFLFLKFVSIKIPPSPDVKTCFDVIFLVSVFFECFFAEQGSR